MYMSISSIVFVFYTFIDKTIYFIKFDEYKSS